MKKEGGRGPDYVQECTGHTLRGFSHGMTLNSNTSCMHEYIQGAPLGVGRGLCGRLIQLKPSLFPTLSRPIVLLDQILETKGIVYTICPMVSSPLSASSTCVPREAIVLCAHVRYFPGPNIPVLILLLKLVSLHTVGSLSCICEYLFLGKGGE